MPVPISATVSTASKVFVVTFSQALTPGVIDDLNWSAVANLTGSVLIWKPMADPVVAGSTVTYTGIPSGSGFGPPTISYNPPPFDLLSSFGTPVAEFNIFPLTILP